MMKRLLKLSVISTVLSLAFLIVSCGDDKDDKKEGTPQNIENLVKFDGVYTSTEIDDGVTEIEEISFSKDGNCTFTETKEGQYKLVISFKISSITSTNNGESKVSLTLTSAKLTFLNQTLVDLANNGQLLPIDDDINLSSIRDWVVNTEKDITNVATDKTKTKIIKVSDDKNTLTVRDDDDETDDGETYTYKQ